MVADQIAHTISTNIIAFNFISFLLGLWAGFRLNLWRDRRQDFNKSCPAIRDWILAELENPNTTPNMPTRVQIEFFISVLPFWKRARFAKHWQQQKQEMDKLPHKRDPDFVSLIFSNTPAREHALNKLLAITKF